MTRTSSSLKNPRAIDPGELSASSLSNYIGGERQVFLTTHSPTFVNLRHRASLYQVRLSDLRTRITRIGSPESLSATLDDIGSRNSDVLLSDAVVFVEGPSDEGAFRAWSETTGMSLDEHNVTLLPTGGNEHAGRNVRLRGDVLTGISHKAGVPHLLSLTGTSGVRPKLENCGTNWAISFMC